MSAFNTLAELTDAIPDEDAAIAHFTAILWKNGARCPYCGGRKVYTFADKKTHKCAAKGCGKRFSIKVGTIFEDTKVPLRKWLMAIWLLASHKKGVASTPLARDIGVTQKTAWFMLHRLRHAATTKSFSRPLEGEVEADETFIGGKESNKHEHKRIPDARGGKGKTAVFGMLERGGELRARKMERLTGKAMKGEIKAHVKPGTAILTDEAKGLPGLGRHLLPLHREPQRGRIRALVLHPHEWDVIAQANEPGVNRWEGRR